MELHLANATALTRQKMQGITNPERSMRNRKPYRTQAQRDEARDSAKRNEHGTFTCGVDLSYHAAPVATFDEED